MRYSSYREERGAVAKLRALRKEHFTSSLVCGRSTTIQGKCASRNRRENDAEEFIAPLREDSGPTFTPNFEVSPAGNSKIPRSSNKAIDLSVKSNYLAMLSLFSGNSPLPRSEEISIPLELFEDLQNKTAGMDKLRDSMEDIRSTNENFKFSLSKATESMPITAQLDSITTELHKMSELQQMTAKSLSLAELKIIALTEEASLLKEKYAKQDELTAQEIKISDGLAKLAHQETLIADMQREQKDQERKVYAFHDNNDTNNSSNRSCDDSDNMMCTTLLHIDRGESYSNSLTIFHNEMIDREETEHIKYSLSNQETINSDLKDENEKDNKEAENNTTPLDCNNFESLHKQILAVHRAFVARGDDVNVEGRKLMEGATEISMVVQEVVGALCTISEKLATSNQVSTTLGSSLSALFTSSDIASWCEQVLRLFGRGVDNIADGLRQLFSSVSTKGATESEVNGQNDPTMTIDTASQLVSNDEEDEHSLSQLYISFNGSAIDNNEDTFPRRKHFSTRSLSFTDMSNSCISDSSDIPQPRASTASEPLPPLVTNGTNGMIYRCIIERLAMYGKSLSTALEIALKRLVALEGKIAVMEVFDKQQGSSGNFTSTPPLPLLFPLDSIASLNPTLKEGLTLPQECAADVSDVITKFKSQKQKIDMDDTHKDKDNIAADVAFDPISLEIEEEREKMSAIFGVKVDACLLKFYQEMMNIRIPNDTGEIYKKFSNILSFILPQHSEPSFQQTLVDETYNVHSPDYLDMPSINMEAIETEATEADAPFGVIEQPSEKMVQRIEEPGQFRRLGYTKSSNRGSFTSKENHNQPSRKSSKYFYDYHGRRHNSCDVDANGVYNLHEKYNDGGTSDEHVYLSSGGRKSSGVPPSGTNIGHPIDISLKSPSKYLSPKSIPLSPVSNVLRLLSTPQTSHLEGYTHIRGKGAKLSVSGVRDGITAGSAFLQNKLRDSVPEDANNIRTTQLSVDDGQRANRRTVTSSEDKNLSIPATSDATYKITVSCNINDTSRARNFSSGDTNEEDDMHLSPATDTSTISTLIPNPPLQRQLYQ